METKIIEHWKNLDLADIKYWCEETNQWLVEEWRVIVGYEDLYKVSNLSRVKSLDRMVRCRGDKFIKRKGKILKHKNDSRGYFCVNLYSVSGKCHTKPIHRLVAQAFIDNPKNNKCVNHIDGFKKNNSIKNLERVTHKENTKHAYDAGLFPCKKGENSKVNRFTEFQIRAIRRLFRMNPKVNQNGLARKLKTSSGNINSILYRHSWKNID